MFMLAGLFAASDLLCLVLHSLTDALSLFLSPLLCTLSFMLGPVHWIYANIQLDEWQL